VRRSKKDFVHFGILSLISYSNEAVKDMTDENDSTLSALLKLAGPTENISTEVEQRVYGNVRDEWEQTTTRSLSYRWAIPFALAASVLLAIALNSSNTDAPVHSVGTYVQTGASIFVGDVIDTSIDGGQTIALDGDISLRVDQRTRLEVGSAGEFTLMAGRIYVDTGDRIYSDRHIIVHTASGTATDIGTQFAVAYMNASMSVAVREGRVDLTDGRQSSSATRGEKMTLRSGGSIEIDPMQVIGSEWEWAVALAPQFELESHTLLDFLKWASRETGMELVFDTNETRAATRVSKSHGSIDGLTPFEAVEAVLATTEFNYVIDGDTISISN
jgi:ferric-dicitrate binding protein FerR (iron transport regulator)